MGAADLSFSYLIDKSMTVIKSPFKLKTVSYSTIGGGGARLEPLGDLGLRDRGKEKQLWSRHNWPYKRYVEN